MLCILIGYMSYGYANEIIYLCVIYFHLFLCVVLFLSFFIFKVRKLYKSFLLIFLPISVFIVKL